jgi:hypothetical protein
MDIERTLAVIAALADGQDPHSRATLPAGHVCQQPDVIRALHHARDIVARAARLERARQRARVTLPHNTGRAWSADEERLLALRFKSGQSVPELAELHGRTRGGIRSRLMLLGLLVGDGAPAAPALPDRPPDRAGRASAQPVR